MLSLSWIFMAWSEVKLSLCRHPCHCCSVQPPLCSPLQQALHCHSRHCPVPLLIRSVFYTHMCENSQLACLLIMHIKLFVQQVPGPHWTRPCVAIHVNLRMSLCLFVWTYNHYYCVILTLSSIGATVVPTARMLLIVLYISDIMSMTDLIRKLNVMKCNPIGSDLSKGSQF